MSMRVPVATIVVDEPTALSSFNTLGWSGDVLFVEEAFRGDLWELGGFAGSGGTCEYIPSMKAIAPQGSATRVDMDLGDWTVESGSWTDLARPAGVPRTRYLWQYDVTPDTAASVVSIADWRPQWCAWIGRYAPPEGTTQPCWFAIEMRGDDVNPAWAIVVPTWDPYGRSWPYLLRDDMPYGFGAYYGGSDWASVVSHLEVDTILETAWAEYVIWCELTANQWIIRMMINGVPVDRPWVYQVPDYTIYDEDSTPCGSGPLRIYSQGQSIMAAVAPIVYPTYSYARPRTYISIPSEFGDPAEATCEALAIVPSGTSVQVTPEVDGQSLRPLVEFVNPTTSRAIVGIVSMYIPPDLGSVSLAPWTSTGTNQLMGMIQYERRVTWRGNTARFTVRDPEGSIAWIGNNVVTLDVGWEESADGYGYPYAYEPTMRRIFTGYITDLRRVKEGTDDLRIEVTAEDYWSARMPHKTMAYTASLGGMLFADAFGEIGARLGFRPIQIVCEDSEGVRLSTPQIIGEPSFAYDETANPEEALDDICRERGWRCGIDAYGRLEATPPYEYTGTPDFILDGDTTEEADVVYSVDAAADLTNFANSVLATVGLDDDLKRIRTGEFTSWAYDEDSWTDPMAANYIGDVWWQVVRREYGATQAVADALAASTLAKARTFRHVIYWQTSGRDLSPGQFVQVSIDVPGVTEGAIYMITDEVGTINIDELSWEQSFTMVRVG